MADAELKKFYTGLDLDGSKRLSIEELNSFYRNRYKRSNLEHAKNLIKIFDYNGDKSIDIIEFQRINANARFEDLDVDNSGTITREEIENDYKNIFETINEQYVDDRMTLIDRNRDGVITKDEFDA